MAKKKTAKKKTTKKKPTKKELGNTISPAEREKLKAGLTTFMKFNEALSICKNHGPNWLAELVESEAPNLAMCIMSDFFIGMCWVEPVLLLGNDGAPQLSEDGQWKIMFQPVDDPRRRDEARRNYTNRLIGLPLQMHRVEKEVKHYLGEIDQSEKEREENAKQLSEIAARAVGRVEAREPVTGRPVPALLLADKERSE